MIWRFHMESLVTILTSIVGSSGVAAAVSWVMNTLVAEKVRNAIKHEYDEKLESHKAQLKAAMDIELEGYKAKLSAENAAAIERLKSQLLIAASELRRMG